MYLNPPRVFGIEREIRFWRTLRNAGGQDTQFLGTKDVVEGYDKPLVFFWFKGFGYIPGKRDGRAEYPPHPGPLPRERVFWSLP